MTSLLRKLTNVAAYAILLLVAFLLGSTRFGYFSDWQAYSVLTGSMSPAIPAGSLIFNKSVTSVEDIAAGDIITFTVPESGSEFVTHRVKAVAGAEIITKGDANANADPWKVAFGNIQGKYVSHVPYLGRLLQFIKSPWGVLLSIVLPVATIFIVEIKNIINVLVDKRVATALKRMKRYYERRHTTHYTAKRLSKPAPVFWLDEPVIPIQRQQKPRPAAISAGFGKIDNVIAPKPVRKHKVKEITKVSIVPLVILLGLLSVWGLDEARAFFVSTKVEISNNSMSTAVEFSTPTPSPTTTPTPTPDVTPSPTPDESPSPTPTESPTATPTPTPSPTVDEGCDVQVDVDISNEDTGPDSENINRVEIENRCNIEGEDSATVENDLEVEVNTGGNSATGNTEGGNIQSGDVKLDFSIQNRL